MKTILIVDDIKENLYLLEMLFQAYGYKTISANNGAEALGLALKDPPDIIVADILMPVMDGYSLCREWKKDGNLKNIPFVFYTATYTHPKDKEFAMSLGAEKFIIKPQEPEVLVQMINSVLEEFSDKDTLEPEVYDSSEVTLLKEYNETLIRKMEERMLKSEAAEKKIRIYAAQLEVEIEERKRAVQALKESETLFRSVIENSAEGFSIIDESGQTIVWNNAMERLTGLKAKEVIAKTAWDVQFQLIPEKERVEGLKENLKSIISELLANGEAPFVRKMLEKKYELPDGTIRYIEGRIIPIKTEKGFILVSSIDNITDRKNSEEEIKRMNEELEFKVFERTSQLEAVNKELESFSYSVSHDLRAPLRAIFGFSQILAKRHRESLNKEGQQYMDYIVEASIRMEQLINDLLNYSRLGRKSLEKRPLQLDSFIKNIELEFKQKLDEIGGVFIVENKLPEIPGDETLLRQIFTNLIENAITYRRIEEPLEIKISSESKDNEVVFKISDNGIGIQKEYQEKIFNIFQRLHSDEKYPGTGIGLANVRKAASMLNGNVWVESMVGKGSTFFVNLPSK